MKSRAASMTGVGLLYPNDFAISNAVSPLTSRCTTRRPSMSPPQQHCATSAESRIRADHRQSLDHLRDIRADCSVVDGLGVSHGPAILVTMTTEPIGSL